MLNAGDRAPDAQVQTMDGETVSLLAHAGTPAVIYFYPKDDTSGCTREAQDFTGLADAFADIGVRVIGISRDTVRKHQSFVAKYGLKVELLSDEDGSACEAFGTWVEKSMYGRKYMGIERATFLIGKDGEIARVWRKVKVAGHAEDVLASARAL